MTAAKLLITATAVCATLTTAGAAEHVPTLRDKQQAACYEDAMRLCGQFVPDPDAVEKCMKPRRKEVSAACAAFY